MISKMHELVPFVKGIKTHCFVTEIKAELFDDMPCPAFISRKVLHQENKATILAVNTKLDDAYISGFVYSNGKEVGTTYLCTEHFTTPCNDEHAKILLQITFLRSSIIPCA